MVFGTMRHFPKKNPNGFSFFCFQLEEKWFPSLIEHEGHPLDVSKLFSEIFIQTFWHILNTLRFLSFRYSADFRRSRLV